MGNGTLDFTSFGTGATSLGGTDLNAQASVLAGDSLGLSGMSHNGAFAQIDLSTAGMADLSLSFATRRTATGFSNNRVEAWIGGSWTLVSTFSGPTTTWEVITVDLSALNALENGLASLRLVFDGATSGSGNIRIDNLTIEGSAVPVPGAVALLGLAGVLGTRRRRAGAA